MKNHVVTALHPIPTHTNKPHRCLAWSCPYTLTQCPAVEPSSPSKMQRDKDKMGAGKVSLCASLWLSQCLLSRASQQGTASSHVRVSGHAAKSHCGPRPARTGLLPLQLQAQESLKPTCMITTRGTWGPD